MKFKRIQLGIKIASLGDEARRIRSKEQTIKLRASRERIQALCKHNGIDQDSPSEELKAELQRRVTPQVERVIGSLSGPDESLKIMRTIDKGARKVIRKFLRQGLSKEEILALPNVQRSFRHVPIYLSLRRHRKGIVRHESRHAQAALSFLRGRPFSRTEDKPASYPNWDKVADIAARFSMEDKRDLMQRFEQWSQEAGEFIRGRQLMTKAAHYPKENYCG